MEKYILYNSTIDGIYREVQIYPVDSVPGEYLVHWDGFEAGMIMKFEDKWYTSSVPLIGVVNELGLYIDQQTSEMNFLN